MTYAEAKRADRFDRYGAVTTWARNRYTRSGSLTTWVGNGVAGLPMRDGKAFVVPSRYTLIEDLAASKLLGCKRHYPDHALRTAYAD